MPRVEFPEDGASPMSQIGYLLLETQSAERAGEIARAAGALHRIENLVTRLTDDALVRADETMSRPDIATGMGLAHPHAHKALAYRINRGKKRHEEEEKTMGSLKQASEWRPDPWLERQGTDTSGSCSHNGGRSAGWSEGEWVEHCNECEAHRVLPPPAG